MAKVIAVVNQKGGVGKTTVTINLGAGLAQQEKRVLLIDYDPQGSLTDCSGVPELLGLDDTEQIEVTAAKVMTNIVNDVAMDKNYGIVRHPEGVDILPANIELAGCEVALVGVMCREQVLKNYISTVKENYDYILIDCMPSLGLLTINALAAADMVIIPVLAEKPSVKGLQQLIRTIGKTRRAINPNIRIGGILPNMVEQNGYEQSIVEMLKECYGEQLKVFEPFPRTVRMAETSAEGKSIFAYKPKGKKTEAYKQLLEAYKRFVEEVEAL